MLVHELVLKQLVGGRIFFEHPEMKFSPGFNHFVPVWRRAALGADTCNQLTKKLDEEFKSTWFTRDVNDDGAFRCPGSFQNALDQGAVARLGQFPGHARLAW